MKYLFVTYNLHTTLHESGLVVSKVLYKVDPPKGPEDIRQIENILKKIYHAERGDNAPHLWRLYLLDWKVLSDA